MKKGAVRYDKLVQFFIDFFFKSKIINIVIYNK